MTERSKHRHSDSAAYRIGSSGGAAGSLERADRSPAAVIAVERAAESRVGERTIR